MNEKDLIEIKSLQVDLNDENSAKLVVQKLIELKNEGYDQVTINVKTLAKKELKKSNLDVEIFKKIKKMQDLPDWVVINLMQAAGKLKSSKFKVRSLNG